MPCQEGPHIFARRSRRLSTSRRLRLGYEKPSLYLYWLMACGNGFHRLGEPGLILLGVADNVPFISVPTGGVDVFVILSSEHRSERVGLLCIHGYRQGGAWRLSDLPAGPKRTGLFADLAGWLSPCTTSSGPEIRSKGKEKWAASRYSVYLHGGPI